MKILYGVAGEGMGHATRSKVTITYLIKRGHTVKVVASGRAHTFLAKDFDALEIVGLELKYADGALNLAGSLAVNLQAGPSMLAKNTGAYQAVEQFDPDLVISDFESFVYLY